MIVPTIRPKMIRPQLPIPGYRKVATQRDAHADGGDAVAADRRARARQAGQPVDEQAERDDVEDRDEVGLLEEGRGERQTHEPASSSSRFGAGFALEHLEHAVGDEEAADDVDRAEDDREHEDRPC